MQGSPKIDWIGKDFATYNPTSTRVDRPLARFKIYPEHRALVNIISSKWTVTKNLTILALAEHYGVRPRLLHDCMRPNSNILDLSRSYIDCIGNVRIYTDYSTIQDESRKSYLYICRIDDDTSVTLTGVTSTPNYIGAEQFVDMPEIKKGNYSVAEKYREIIAKLKEV